MTDWTPTPDQLAALKVAHKLADMGAPIFAAHRNSLSGDFLYPHEWQHTKAGQVSHNWIERWRPGMALCMVTGVVFDVMDMDPRNGAYEGVAQLAEGLGWDTSAHGGPICYGVAKTPSEGEHTLIGRTHLAKGKPAPGIDLQAGADDGTGRGFIFIAPTVRVSKWGKDKGQGVAYRWVQEPWGPVRDDDPGLMALVEHCKAQRAPRRAGNYGPRQATAGPVNNDDPFFDSAPTWTPAEADRVIANQVKAVEAARDGEINNALGGAARVLGRFVAGGYLAEENAVEMLMEALDLGGVHSDAWNIANGKGWTAATCIGAGLANGGHEPWVVATETPPSAIGGESGSTSRGASLPDGDSTVATSTGSVTPGSGSVTPALQIESSATMAYWLQNTLGSGALSGFFLRGGRIVHTPRVDDLGYVPAREGKDDDNGPAQIKDVSAGILAAKIQYAYRCYKLEAVKGDDGKKTGETREVDALFPQPAAQRAVDAPEAMGLLRPLRGITYTPMVRADGSILGRPGYDPATGYLFLPGAGVDVAAVPETPTLADTMRATALLDEMTAGFPWESDDDRANYFGLLLTPLLRLVAPPSYKMFGIGAHQPGSGKTLLADVARIIHGGVLRSEMPDKEYEIKQMTTALLVGTSAPVVHIDNVTGVIRSSTLAGLLTADGDIQERELGQNTGMLTYTNDRVWVITGNNLSLGGDLVRRTIIITIDPNMANPEERQFAIADLKAWAHEHRNELLWALLVLIRHWVAGGRALEERKQSDSFAAWEAAVGGILASAGIAGRFDAQSGKKAAAGGDDDGLAQVLERIWEVHQGQDWTVSRALTPRDGEFVLESMDWLPASVLDKLSRSAAAGKKAMGYWLRNRLGRWVTGSDGRAYVIRRRDELLDGSARWHIERH